MQRPLPLVHPLFLERAIVHGFGVRGAVGPSDLVRPRQVHGCTVAVADARGAAIPAEADAIIACRPDLAVGILTADCVPILIAAEGGDCVAAIHGGWRGIAKGVVSATVSRLGAMGVPPEALWVVIGPHIGPCCYEVDEPVVSAMRAAFGQDLKRALGPSAPARWKLALGKLVRMELRRLGIPPGRVGELPNSCTCCGEAQFFSYRREGEAAGRLVHFIRTKCS
jgi:polyphenol oxidase